MAKAANVTKYDAGGSGDNYISDGYIKTVEKIWLDNYTIGFTNTKTTIDIAKIDDNKKIVGIDVMIETSASQTNATLSIGHQGDANYFVPATKITHNLTMSTITFPSGGAVGATVAEPQLTNKLDGFQMVTDGTTGTITLTLGHAWTMTTGTVKTKVRYT